MVSNKKAYSWLSICILHNNMALLVQEVEKIEPGSAEWLFRFFGSGEMKYGLGIIRLRLFFCTI